MTAVRHALAYDLTVRSTLPIPGALPIAGGVADIEVREGAVADEGKAFGPYRLRADAKLVFEAPGVARYLCDAESIMVERIGDGDVSGFLIATALPAVLWMRGEIVLHAAAAVMPGAAGAIAIMGASGSGKSTVLRAMVAMGARIVADDSLCVRGTGGSGLAGGYFLGEPPRAFHPVADGLAAAPLAGIVLLERSEGAPEMKRLPKLEALTTLIGNRHRPRIPVILGLQPGLMVPLAELAGAVPVHVWKRREGATGLEAGEIALLGGAG